MVLVSAVGPLMEVDPIRRDRFAGGADPPGRGGGMVPPYDASGDGAGEPGDGTARMIDDGMTDEELVRRWQAGGDREDVFARLTARYGQQLARLFRRMGFDDETIEDLAQNALCQVFESLDGFRGRSSLRTWLYRIARNAGLKELRRRRAQKRSGLEVPLDDLAGEGGETPGNPHLVDRDHGPLDRLISEEERRRVRAAVDELSPAERNLALMRIWHGRSVRDAARVLKKPEGTIKSGWARVRAKLSKKLGAQFSDLPP